MTNRTWLLSTAERAIKTFLQGYVTFWLLAAGLTNTGTEVANADAFDLLFRVDNLKAGVVAMVLSLVTSVVSTPLGPDKAAPSVVVSENPPTV